MTHEDFSRKEAVKPSSDRGFGLAFSAIFLIVSVWPLVRGDSIRWWALAVATVFALLTLFWAVALTPLNRMWSYFGSVLHLILTPVIMGVLFYGVVTPTAFFMRRLGKDPLRLRPDPNVMSYWIEKAPSDAGSMKNQF
jgi:predicted membrane metal-binding protein